MMDKAKNMAVTWYKDHEDTIIGVFGLILVAGLGVFAGNSKGYKDGFERGYRNGIRDLCTTVVDVASEDA